MERFLLFFIFLLSFPFLAEAQRSATLRGKIICDGKALEVINVRAIGTNFRTESDLNGHYLLRLVPGKYKIACSGVGFETSLLEITVKAGEHLEHNFQLKKRDMTLNAVEIKAKSAIQEVRETPFNVVALDAKSQYNTTLNLAQLLDKASGVKIRETGGVGSDMSISLNGFTGRHVKVFLDGVPMQGFGSSFQLNNIPVSLAERIEVYKGVVPIEFGADAIGGVINIVTNQSTNSYLDASYSYGSFNTHRSNFIIGHTTDKGFSFQINAYQTYSDNNYRIKTSLLDANGKYQPEQYYERFHDTYHNEAIVAKAGVVNKRWADRFLVGLTFSQQQQDVQNSATNMRFVYGARENFGKGISPSLEYYKRNLITNGLTLRITGNLNLNNMHNVDTASYVYNWLGERTLNASKGEGGSSINSLSDYRNYNYSTTANINYQINEKHSFALNDVYSSSSRKTSTDMPIDALTLIETLRRLSVKNVLGVSYRYRYSRNWNVNVFGKNYYQKAIGPLNEGDEAHPNFIEQTGAYNTTGYGIATTYFIKTYQLKASMEHAYRLPTDNELFGDEIQEAGNASLKAENSMNYNLGALLNKPFQNKDMLYVDVNGFYRNTKDFIRREDLARSGGITNVNHGRVRTIGVDAEARYYFRNKAMIGATATYQDLRNKEPNRSASGTASSGQYNDRMKNIPYLFGNAEAAYYIHGLGGKGNVLNLNYALNYTHEFFLHWESQASSGNKLTIPQQLSHDLTLTYILKNGRYNFSLEARDITNEELYDNFGMMKPGRAFYGKFRYYLIKRK